MGYTHYFAYDPNAEAFTRAWPQMVDDARAITSYVQKDLRIKLAGGEGTGTPELTERWICLNGSAARHLDHETLLIDAQPWRTWDENAALGFADWARMQWERFTTEGFVWSFCKTARKPYDIAVTTILLRCAHIAPDAFVIDSDGAWEQEWQHGASHWQPDCESGPAPIDLVRTLFGQIETPTATRLSDSGAGPPSARGRTPRARARSLR